MAKLKLLFRISLKNIFRNKRRTLITLMILLLGSSGLILVGGFFDSLLERLREYYIYSGVGHFQIAREGYYDKGSTAPLEYLVDNFSTLKKRLKDDPGVKEVLTVLKSEGILSTEDTTTSVIAVGVDPVAEENVSSAIHKGYRGSERYSKLLEGHYLSPDDPYGITIGEDLQRALGLKSGDTVSFLTTRRFGAIDGAEFHVRGVFRTPIKEVGERLIKVPVGTLQEILDVPDQAHTLNVFIFDTEMTGLEKGRLEKKFDLKGGGMEIISWDQMGAVYHQSRNFLDGIYKVVQIIMAIIFFLSIANTTNMTIFERMREYGTMMAIGNGRWTVFSVIFLETCILGIFGSLLGGVMGSLAGEVITSLYIMMPPPPMITTSHPVPVFIALNAQLLLGSMGLTFLAAVFSAIIPGYRASHFKIIHALGYV